MLFAPQELARAARTAQARLKRLAQEPMRSPTESELRSEDDRAMMRKLRRWGTQLGSEFGLRYASLDPEKDGVVEHYGVCYEDGAILIRLRHARTGRMLKESSLVDTLCHELAHLKHLDHSIRFRRLYEKILARARRLGIYRPGPSTPDRPFQLDLFDGSSCGTSGKARTARGR
ncbi:MAG: DUF45 domain-containing protein [bacterium]|nr:DUF45 domain-containing protein [bacterium]